MKPLIVLLTVFVGSLVVLKLLTGQWDYRLAGNIAMAAMLLFTAIGHFVFTKGMTMMIPAFVPFKREVVYLTGVLEIAFSVGLLIPSFRPLTATLLIVFFVLLLPANIYAAVKGVDYQRGVYVDQDLTYLWFRIPLQVLFIGWVAYFSLYFF